MFVGPGVAMLEIPATMAGKKSVIYPTLFSDDETALLVDTGFSGQEQLFADAIRQHRVDIQRLQAIILTHQDIDHIGSATRLLEMVSHKVSVLCDTNEKPYIEGGKRLVKLTPEAIDEALRKLPADMPELAKERLRFALENPPKVHVDGTTATGDGVSQFGGLSVIATYGHTPGHIAVYHKASRCVVLGDCVEIVDGRLSLPDKRLCSDFDQARQSLRNLLEHEIDSAIAYHGGLIDHKVRSQIEALIA